ADIALASRDLAYPSKKLDMAAAVLKAHGDATNAAYAAHLDVRRLALIGRLDQAEQKQARLDPTRLPPALLAAHELAAAGIAIRRLKIRIAETALSRAREAARRTAIPALKAEVETAMRALAAPAARLIVEGRERLLNLAEVEALLESKTLVVD